MPDQVPDEIVKLAEELFIPAFIERLASRGYTYIENEDQMKQALEVVEKLEAEQMKAQKLRNKLAKEASDKYLKDN